MREDAFDPCATWQYLVQCSSSACDAGELAVIQHVESINPLHTKEATSLYWEYEQQFSSMLNCYDGDSTIRWRIGFMSKLETAHASIYSNCDIKSKLNLIVGSPF